MKAIFWSKILQVIASTNWLILTRMHFYVIELMQNQNSMLEEIQNVYMIVQ